MLCKWPEKVVSKRACLFVELLEPQFLALQSDRKKNMFKQSNAVLSAFSTFTDKSHPLSFLFPNKTC